MKWLTLETRLIFSDDMDIEDDDLIVGEGGEAEASSREME